jgi:hypothetical protein
MERIVSLAVIFCCLISIRLTAQTCAECQKRSLIIYDNEIKFPRPDFSSMTVSDQLAAYREWISLYYLAAGYRKYAQEDATADCIFRLCSAFFTETDSINESIKSGIDNPNIPPAGSVESGDYILYGIISGELVNCSLKLKLETAQSRELVKEFEIDLQAGFDPVETGYNAAARFGQLYNTFMNFEKKKRDEGEPYAIKPTVEIISGKSKIKANETTSIAITVTDCDGKALKNRTIRLASGIGSLESKTLTTDDSGKCSTNYTTGSTGGVVKISANIQYVHPYHLTTSVDGELASTFIEVEEAPYWKIEGDYTFEETVSFVQTIGTSGKTSSQSSKSNSGHFKAALDVKSYGNGIFSTKKTISENLSGNYTETYDEKSIMQVNDESGSMYSTGVKNRQCESPITNFSDQTAEISFIPEENNQIAFTVPSYTPNGGGQSNLLITYCKDGNCTSSTISETADCEASTFADGTHSYDIPNTEQDTTYSIIETPANGMTTTTTIHQKFKKAGGIYYFTYESIQTNVQEIVSPDILSTQTTVNKEYVDICILPSDIGKMTSATHK